MVVVVLCGACSRLRSEAMYSFPPSISLHHHRLLIFKFVIVIDSQIPGIMIPVARAHLMEMAAFAVVVC